jgi:acyl-coenzyme A thioesterase PaaI-like protein
MKPLAPPNAQRGNALRANVHPHCVVCGSGHPRGLGLECTPRPDGSVEGEFSGGALFEGYVGRLHGGVIAALLDGAMTHCLFAHGRKAFTAELVVRYRQPVAAADALAVRAWLTDSRARLHLLKAELRQNGQVKVTAVGKFIESGER